MGWVASAPTKVPHVVIALSPCVPLGSFWHVGSSTYWIPAMFSKPSQHVGVQQAPCAAHMSSHVPVIEKKKHALHDPGCPLQVEDPPPAEALAPTVLLPEAPDAPPAAPLEALVLLVAESCPPLPPLCTIRRSSTPEIAVHAEPSSPMTAHRARPMTSGESTASTQRGGLKLERTTNPH